MNEISKRDKNAFEALPDDKLPAATDKNAFEAYADSADRNKIVGSLLRFRKGQYFAGIDEQEIPIGTELIALMDELHIGWIKWADSRPVDAVQGKVAEGYVPSRRADLGDTNRDEWETDEDTGLPKDPWQPVNSLVLKELLSTELYTLTASSKGGIGAIASLAGEYGKHIRAKPDEYPVVILGASSYKHPKKKYGTIHVPTLEIVEWTSKGPAQAALAGIEEEPEPAPLPPPKPEPTRTGYKPEGRKPRF